MNHLILTDAHIGYKDVNLPEMYDKIKEQHTFQKVITLGDMIDLWRTNIDDVLIEQEDNIKFLKSKCINIFGNHDYIMPNITNIKYFEKYDLEGYTFIHGHQFEAMTSELPYTSQEDYEKICNRMCYCSKSISNVLTKVYNFNNVGSKSHKKRIDKVVKLASVCYDSVVFGHYHTHKQYKNAITLPALCDGYYTIYKNGEFEVYKM